jgi:hypothetical protein
MKRVSLATLLLFDLLAFGPLLLTGRLYTSQGWVRAHDPWRSADLPSSAPVQPLLADVGDANAPALARLRERPAGFLWNPWVSAGVPGSFELAQGMLSPFAWLPALLLPEAAIETGILFLKTQFAFFAMLLFLRRRRFADAPAALGAAAWAFSTGQTVWGLWMQSSVSILYPLLLVSVDAAFRAPARKALAFAAGTLLLLLSGGFPHWIVYGAVAAGVFFLLEARARPPRAARAAAVLAAAGAIALAALSPSVLAATRVLARADYASLREHLGSAAPPLPLSHLALYVFPAISGTPLSGDWKPLGWIPGENAVETAVGIGPAAAGLALAGFLSRRRARLAGFCAILAIGFGLLLYAGGAPARLIGRLPPFDTALLARSKILIVFALAIASACGLEILARSSRAVALLAPLAPLSTALALAPMLAAFHPAAPPQEAVFAKTPGLAKLASDLQETKGRFAAVGWVLPPNVPMAFALEDVRGHFFHEADYRRLLSDADPAVFGEHGTYLIFDPRTFRADSPALDALAVTTLALPPRTPPPLGTREIYAGADLTLVRRPSALARFRLASPGGETLQPAPRVEIRESGRFRIVTEAAGPARLLTSEKRWDPYWEMRLDGRGVAPADDGVFLALDVPAGRHVVEGRFRIPAVEIALAAAGWIALALVAVRGLRRTRPA